MTSIRCLFLLCIVASCGTGNRHSGFPAAIPTTTSQCDFDSVYLQFPYRVRIVDSLLYVVDLHAGEYFCHSFTYPRLKHRTSFAPRGKASNELLSAGNFIVAGSEIYLLDVFGKKIYCWDGRQIAMTTELPVEIHLCLDFAMYDDSTFVFPDYTGEQRLIFVHRNGRMIRKTGLIPASESAGIPKAALGQAWRPFISYNPRNGILALVTQLGEVLEVYDLRNGKVHVHVGLSGKPRFRMNTAGASPTGIMGYGDVSVGDRYIYAVFWGHDMDKIKSGQITQQGGDLFRVFDLEGNPVREYLIDQYITGFHVDEAPGRVVGTDANNEQLVFFSL